MSGVRCQVSCVTYIYINLILFWFGWVKGLLSTGPTQSSSILLNSYFQIVSISGLSGEISSRDLMDPGIVKTTVTTTVIIWEYPG